MLSRGFPSLRKLMEQLCGTGSLYNGTANRGNGGAALAKARRRLLVKSADKLSQVDGTLSRVRSWNTMVEERDGGPHTGAQSPPQVPTGGDPITRWAAPGNGWMREWGAEPGAGRQSVPIPTSWSAGPRDREVHPVARRPTVWPPRLRRPVCVGEESAEGCGCGRIA